MQLTNGVESYQDTTGSQGTKVATAGLNMAVGALADHTGFTAADDVSGRVVMGA
jgi:hypothetical protein